MKKEYKAPIVEKLEFNYQNTVVASGLNLLGTTHEQWCHGPNSDESSDNA